MDKISESGIIDRAGRMRFPMDRIQEYAKARPGMRIMITIQAFVPGSTELQQGYYYGYILPCVVESRKNQGTRMTEAQADDFLLRQFPGDVDNALVGGKYAARRLDKAQMSDFLDWLKQYCAENLSIYIEDPKTL